MPEPFPPQTWPEGAIPTVDQLRAWIKTFEDHHDARIAADMIAGMLEAAWQEYRRASDLYAETFRKMRRYRFAWLSARRGRSVGQVGDLRRRVGDLRRCVVDLGSQVAAVDQVLAHLDGDTRTAVYDAVRAARASREG